MRRGMGLESANFSLQKKERYLLSAGAWHRPRCWFFLSSAEMRWRKNGSNAEEILKKYFPDMELRVENPEN